MPSPVGFVVVDTGKGTVPGLRRGDEKVLTGSQRVFGVSGFCMEASPISISIVRTRLGRPESAATVVATRAAIHYMELWIICGTRISTTCSTTFCMRL